MGVTDAHFHVWRQADLPWLTGPMVPRIFGPYEALRRDYPMAEYRAEAGAAGVNRAVYVQANWPPERAEAEVAWVSGLAEETGWPHAIVGYADMTVADVRPALDRLAQFPLLRGIRQQLHWHENPLYRFASVPELCADPQVQRNVARLADYGLTFELQVFAPQMAGACALVDACENVSFVLQHSGMLEKDSEESFEAWARAVAELAERPNVYAKLSGFGTFLRRLDPAQVARITAHAVRVFGPERCLWGSNFPIEKLWTDYAALLDAHRAAAGVLPRAAQDEIFNETAGRVYRLH